MLHLEDKENVEKFNAKSDEGIFLGCSSNSRAYHVYNKRTKTVMELIDVVVDDKMIEALVEDETGKGVQTNDHSIYQDLFVCFMPYQYLLYHLSHGYFLYLG